ncbi:SNW domain-containing protein 1 [Mitosporidium daphniae]|uniref:Pre-mRNA-processing protein 45 n=1 Tax=Mitosporidium daphniae TaxID=1485682 RepID=A0A098VV20_9MICR|nr:puff-specific protein Bx42 [Mitosporidium daphniae]KGG52797.1 puff-specific protein Bx42 [Mitosporidium daphniae]|eukprot:XP_013239233.1 puff-specific protein Bx42 [Mitosporidium daphniae]
MDKGLVPLVSATSIKRSPLRGISGTISLSGSVLPKILDSKGMLQYDTTVRVGHSASRIIYARDSDSRPRRINDDEQFPRPSQEEINTTTELTRKALEAIVSQRIKSTLPKQEGLSATQASTSKLTMIEYKPSALNLLVNPDAPKNRVIKMVEAQADPLDPAKFKHRKIPRGPPSPPVPVLHSPIRKATSDEYKAWIVPPSISNWKNPKGYTIPLDKRLACDGRSLQESVINDKFAAFAESLYVAEAHAREEVARRNALERSLAANERLEKEARLREIAKETRAAAFAHQGSNHHSDEIYERDALRRDVARHRAAEYNKRGSVGRERDISEKIALNVPISASGGPGSSLFDTRLYNQTEGISSNFSANDDTYAVYEKPLFSGSASSLVYRPNVRQSDINGELTTEETTMSKRPRAGLGSESGGVSRETAPLPSQRTGPVQFERGGVTSTEFSKPEKRHVADNDAGEDDPFGLDTFLQTAKRGRQTGK